MLRILLLILKILGIVLFSVLGLILLFTLIVLFVPIRYKVRAKKENETWMKARVKWLFGIVSIECDYKEEKLTYSARICGKLIVSDKPKKKKKKKKRNKKPPKVTKVIQSTKEEKEELLIEEPLKESIEEPLKETLDDTLTDSYDTTTSFHESPLKEEPKRKEKKDSNSIFHRIKSLPKRLFHLLKRIKDKILSLLITIKKVFKKINRVKAFLKDTTNRLGFSKVIMYLKRVLRHIKPRKFVLKVKFGTGDPSTTGQLLGFICAVYPLATNKFQLQPDFEEKKLIGELYARGRIRVFTLLVIAIKVLRDQDVKRLRQNITKLKEEL